MRLVREEDLTRANKKVKRDFALYLAIACVYLAAALLLLFFSPDSYVPFLIADSVISAAFGVFSVYFFTVSFHLSRKKRDRIEKALSALPEKDFGVYLSPDGERTEDGVRLVAYLFLVRGNEREYKSFTPLSLQEGGKYLIESGAGFLLALEEEDESLF